MKNIPVVVFSTSSNVDIIERMFDEGANYYITKPASFILLKKAISYVLSLDDESLKVKPIREKFEIKFT